MGRTVESTIGLDVMGHVRRVGSSVAGIQPHDCVAALVCGGAIKNRIVTKARFLTKYRPEFVPSLYICAYMAVIDIGLTRSDRKVLVQAGASAYGLAAVQMAMSVYAEVFVTVLGADSARQRESLVQCGLADDHIIDASSDSFVKAVQVASKGKGVDVVFNPTVEHVEASFKCVRKCKQLPLSSHHVLSADLFQAGPSSSLPTGRLHLGRCPLWGTPSLSST